MSIFHVSRRKELLPSCYLPAYLLITCADYYEGDVISQGLPSRFKTYGIEDGFYHISSLTGGQLKVTANAPDLMSKIYQDEDARDALEAYWAKFLSGSAENKWLSIVKMILNMNSKKWNRHFLLATLIKVAE